MKDLVDEKKLQIQTLEKMDSLVRTTKNFSVLIAAAEKSSMISPLEKNIIVTKFGTLQDQQTAFYLLLNSKACPEPQVVNLLRSTGNESVVSVLQQKIPQEGMDEWVKLKKIIVNNIDRLSSHTMNLSMVLCFASGVGLITGKDREIIASYSAFENDQLKKFYTTVSQKSEDAYEKLLQVLKMTSNNWALDVLEVNIVEKD